MFCSQCGTLNRLVRLAGESSPRRVCPRCRLTSDVVDSLNEGIPRFVNPYLLAVCAFLREDEWTRIKHVLGTERELPSWLACAPKSMLQTYVEALLRLMSADKKMPLPIGKTMAQEVLTESLVRLKRHYYGEEESKEHFDPRREGEHHETFLECSHNIENALSQITQRWGDLRKCSGCSIHCDRGFLTVQGRKRICLGCVGTLG